MNSPTPAPRPLLWTSIGRALRLRCPRCGEGRLFAGLFRMLSHCSHCRLKYEQAPGFFLGSAYFNYGLTALILMATYTSLHFGVGLSHRALTPWLIAFCVLFPLFFFRYARSLWLAMDCYFDVTGSSQNDEG